MADRRRTFFQLAWTALTNGYAAGFLKGNIYRGTLKRFCLPGLNCYSCPGALGACPVGSFQAALTGTSPHFPAYVLGFLLFFGALAGRLVCGWLCPFGLVQDLLHKIPGVKKRKNLPGHSVLLRLKYVVLAALVVILPLLARDELLNVSDPWFCKYLCPSGTLMGGVPLLALNEGFRGAAGLIFGWKSLILVALMLLSVKCFRPFCKYLCPLGAFYGFFNTVALFRYRFRPDRCTGCGACAQRCPMGVALPQRPNSAECIRCGRCLEVCPTDALTGALKRDSETPSAAKPQRQSP